MAWAVDKTPSTPTPKAEDCTLNLNDGTSYNAAGVTFKFNNQAAPWSLPALGQVKASLWTWFDGDTTAETTHWLRVRMGDTVVTTWDLKASPIAAKQWVQLEADLTGKSLAGSAWLEGALRPDSAGNTGAGWFIDGVKIVHRAHPDGHPCDFDTDCNDGDQCRPDLCIKGRCVNDIKPGLICADGNACTDSDTCDDKGVCQAGKSKVCTDSNACTDDTCDPATGCIFTATTDGKTCDDGSSCTVGESCQGGLCLGKGKCDDDNPCTLNACAADGTCSAKALTDGMSCDGGGTCKLGVCVESTKLGWAKQISGNGHRYAVLRNNGEVWGWGLNNGGQLGDGTKTASSKPIKAFVSGAIDVCAGEYLSCALTVESGVRNARCWGFNQYGMGGAVNSGVMASATLLRGMQHLRDLDTEDRNTCGVRMDGTVWCVGRGYYGVLNGVANTPDSYLAVQVPGIAEAVQVAVSSDSACALKIDGTVWCWGRNSYAGMGTGIADSDVHKPSQVATLSGVRQLAGGKLAYCAVKFDGTAWCWGTGRYGSLGDGNTSGGSSYSGPAPVKDLTAAVEVSISLFVACARRSSGAVSCWGSGGNGSIGNGENTTQGTAGTTVKGVTDAVAVHVDEYSACAVTADGSTWCWGAALHGQLGDGQTTTNSNEPVLVTGSK